jgi:microcompartment protein CcmK/EutM
VTVVGDVAVHQRHHRALGVELLIRREVDDEGLGDRRVDPARQVRHEQLS